MPQNSSTYIIGDVRDCLAAIPDGSIDLVMTSPPFLALRSYLPADHPDKHREIGSEPDPATFLDTLLLLTAEWGRVLAPHGSICVELGDTYSGSGGAGGDYNPDGLRDGQSKFEGSNQRRGKVVDHNSGRRNPPDTWPLPKSLCGIPHLYHLSLAYGRNLLTGEESPAGRWRVRNVVAWCRPNPPVGALGDKFRPATSYMTIATRAQKRYFDLDSCRSLAPPSRSTRGAELGSATVGREIVGTFDAGHGPNDARWWCDFSFAQIAVHGPMTGHAEDEQIIELVGLQVGVEAPEGAHVVDLQPVDCSASLAGVPVAVEGLLSRFLPVGTSITDPPATKGGAVLSSPVGRAPSAVALKAAEVVSLDGALIPGDRLAARLTLKIDGAISYAWLIAPVSDTLSHKTDSIKSGQSNGAPPLDYWVIPTAPYSGSHYAVYPPALCERPIKSMVPAKVCTVCGAPSERIVESSYDKPSWTSGGTVSGLSRQPDRVDQPYSGTTIGWSECECPDDGTKWRPGVVLDPFAGSGTTLMVANELERDAIGFDLDERNASLARDRVDKFLFSDFRALPLDEFMEGAVLLASQPNL